MLCIQRERVVELLFAGVTSALMREVLGVDPSEDNRCEWLVHISCMLPGHVLHLFSFGKRNPSIYNSTNYTTFGSFGRQGEMFGWNRERREPAGFRCKSSVKMTKFPACRLCNCSSGKMAPHKPVTFLMDSNL